MTIELHTKRIFKSLRKGNSHLSMRVPMKWEIGQGFCVYQYRTWKES